MRQMNIAGTFFMMGSLVTNDLPRYLGRVLVFFTAMYCTTLYFNSSMILLRDVADAMLKQTEDVQTGGGLPGGGPGGVGEL